MVSKKQRGVGRLRDIARGRVHRGLSSFTRAMWGMPQTTTPASTRCATHYSPTLTPPFPHTLQAIWWMQQTSTPASTQWATPLPTHCSAPCQHRQGHQHSPPSGPSQQPNRSTPHPRVLRSTSYSRPPRSTAHLRVPPSTPHSQEPHITPQPRVLPSTPYSQVPPSTLHRRVAPSIQVPHPLLGAPPPLPLLLPLTGPPLPPLHLPLVHLRLVRRLR